MHGFLKVLDNFARNQRGNFAAMFAMIGVVLLLGSATAIDVSRMFSTHQKLVYALDAAVLATTRGLTLGDIDVADADAAVRRYLDANLDGRTLTKDNVIIDAIDVDSDARTVQLDAHTLMPMSMAGIVGYEKHRIEGSSKAKYSDTAVEVAMALDITGSMDEFISGTGTKKIAALKTAAKLGIDTLYNTPGTADRIRVGLVPYSASVNANPVIGKIETTAKTKGCVFERVGAQKYTDAFADINAKVGGTMDKDCPSSTIMPLTTDKAALKAQIDAMNTGGCTAGHVAVAWSYYMLSPKWNPAWPDGSDASEYGPAGARKVAILMTDGIFNFHKSTNSSGCNDALATQKSREFALELCNSMKTSGIKIYSITFSAPADAAQLMKSCATADSATSRYFYNTTNQAELESAFVAIAQDIQGLKLVN